MALTTDIETIDERPVCCTYAAGRVFFGMNNSLYFSQVMEGEAIDFLNRCFQKNDPTAEQLSDLLATDGGVIPINNAVNIKQVMNFQGGAVVYAQNGVWFVSGPDTGFSATNHFVERISNSGIASPQSVVQVEDSHYYWSQEGIFTVRTNQFGKAEATSIIEGTMQTFYNAIGELPKENSNGTYDRIKKQIEWFYSSSDQTSATSYKHAKDKSLLFDLRSGGIWPQEYNATSTEGAGNFLVDSVSTRSHAEETEITYLTITGGAVTSTQDYSVDFGFKTDATFQDFSSNFPTAYIETGYESLDKPSNVKTAPFVSTHFNQTEENFVADGSGGFKLDLQSGCQMRAKWDWNNSSANGRWSPSQQAYRFRRLFVPTGAGVFDSGESVITTKSKILGRGKALSLRFEQEANKDMQLMGYTVQWSIKGRM